MADADDHPSPRRYALVSGANRGIGLEICRQLASKGMVVILAARDEKRGLEARESLKELGNVVFHQLDVADAASVAAVADFVRSEFGRLDILVNNAASLGLKIDGDVLVLHEQFEADVASVSSGELQELVHPKAKGTLMETLEWAQECVNTNYYGLKRVTEALIPLLQLSESPTIVNVSSTLGSLVLQPNEWVKGVLSSVDGLKEERIDEVVQEYLKNFKEGSLRENKWPLHISAYKVSKAAVNAYTRLMAKKHKAFYINSVCPGYTRTELTYNLGLLTDTEGAEAPVKLALAPEGGPSGSIFRQAEVLSLF
ncbi:(-)-isopiperitenone reductase-like [Salvia splendens]|uniref:(-)-isopiperitenone reductase-like n=1 Tax=Salvia splendens TaxID=180675 RepID=UPI001C27CBCE|nr:(-)-isopiperitenone reductase-like [Salvia splendens]